MLVPLLRLLTVGAAAVAAAPSVTLPSGATVTGLLETNVAGNPVQVFRGIPYAEPPVGERRWKPSTLKPLTQDLTATKYGGICYGIAMYNPVSGQYPPSEDCLFLNVFAPANATKDSKLPVMVWIHGGAFVAGAANSDEAHNILAAANEGVVVVTINYRLGVFGFFSNKQILAEGSGANFGLRDQEVAFEWVHQYISSFGGDPTDITAFGESAGAMSIALHMLSRDGDQKLFHRTILQSGAYTTTHDIATPTTQQNQTTTIAQGVGCGSATDVMACLRQANATAIFATGGALNWIPTVDGDYMKDIPLRRLLAGKVSQVPTISGTNADEGWLFTFTAAEASQFDGFVRSRFAMLTESEYTQVATLYAASAFATAHHRTAEIFADVIFTCPSEQLSEVLRVPNYRYRFNHTSSEFGTPLVVHAKDVPYVFNQVATLPKDDDTKLVVKHFQQYWTNFALSGSPNTATDSAVQQSTTPETVWPEFSLPDMQQLVIQPALAMETSGTNRIGHAERCAFWRQVELRIAAEVKFLE